MKKENFNWGLVINEHKIGPYVILEYHPRKVEGVTVTREIDKGNVRFHGYIDSQDTCEGWGSLDEALVGLIVRRTVGMNSSLIAYHFMAGLRGIATNSTRG